VPRRHSKFRFLRQVHVEFSDGGDVIKIDGPPEETEKAREVLEAQAKELIRTMDFAEISVDAKYHKHIIGKGGSTGEKVLKFNFLRSWADFMILVICIFIEKIGDFDIWQSKMIVTTQQGRIWLKMNFAFKQNRQFLAEYFLYKRPLQSRVRNKIFKSW
jgi:hypothetical protein